MSSRVSSKSSLSPSSGSGSNRIDLGKDSGIDMGKKSQVSASSGGIGVTQEITSIGGVSVTGGVSVDVSPIGLDISGNPEKGEVSIAASAEVPGGIVGLGGGVTVDTGTGQVKGGSISGEVGGFGVEISTDEDGNMGLGVSVQIPFSPITIELGIEQKKEEKKPTPTPTPTSPSIPDEPPSRPQVPNFPLGQTNGICTVVFTMSRTIFEEVFSRVGSFQYRWVSWHQSSASAQISGNQITYTFGTSGKSQSTYPNSPPFIDEYSYGPDSYNNLPFSSEAPDRMGFYLEVAYYAGRGPATVAICRGRYQEIKRYITYIIENFAYQETINFNSNGTLARRRIDSSQYKISWSNCFIDPAITPPSPASPPNPPPRKKMDECCRTSIKFLRAIYKGLGIQKFPGQLPSTIIQEVAEEGATPAEPPQEPIADFADLLMWQFARDDERWGQWQIQIKVKDTDLTKEGDQSKQIKFPNLAESIAEMEGQLLAIQSTVEALLPIQTKALIESGMARQEAMKGYLAAKTLIKYFAFKTAEKDFKYPMTFTIGAEKISDLIEESEGHVVGLDYEEKETARDIFADLLQAAAIIRAVHWQKLDPKKNTKLQLLELLKGSVNLAASLADKSTEGESKSENWEDFTDRVQDGFRNSTGISDIQNPYGRTPDRRPRIRQIGDNISQAGGNN